MSTTAATTATSSDYDPGDYPAVAVTVDIVVLTIAASELQVLLIQRGAEPFLGRLALPGGFVRPDETLHSAAARELREETNVSAAKHMEQLAGYGDPERDPRMRVITIAYLAVLPRIGRIAAGTDARRAALVPVADVLGRRPKHSLAFDHSRILSDGAERARQRLEVTSIATAFVEREFTLPQLRAVYEAVWGYSLDPGNFRRKVLATPGFVVPTGRNAKSGPGGGKPAVQYRAGSRAELDPPLRRPGPST